MGKKAIFLDRDGVINEDKGYVCKKEDFVFTRGVFEVLRHFLEKNYLLIVVTNQSGIARGFYSEADFWALSDYMLQEFEKQNITITKIYHCPHAPESGCPCRKPKPKMILDAASEFDIDLSQSWLIGDKPSDIEAALNAKVANTVLLGDAKSAAKYKVKNLYDTIKLIF